MHGQQNIKFGSRDWAFLLCGEYKWLSMGQSGRIMKLFTPV